MAGRRMIFLLSVMLICFVQAGFSGVPYQGQPEERALAIRIFEEGKFREALPLFSRLCYNYPYDFLVKYYFGACLVESGTFSTEAEKNLVLASSADVPVKVNYYLGKLYHGLGNWNNAQRYYNRFKNNAKASEIQELNIDELISLCYREINPFLPASTAAVTNREETAVPPAVANPPVTAGQLPETGKVPSATGAAMKQDSVVQKELLPDLTGNPKVGEVINGDSLKVPDQPIEKDSIPSAVPEAKAMPVLPEFIEFQINEKVTYLVEDMFRVAEAKNEFRIATDKEQQLDSLLAEVQQLRKLYHQSVKPSVRDSLATRIQNLEYRNLILNTEVGQHYFQSRKLEQEWWVKNEYAGLDGHLAWRDSLLNLSRQVMLQEQAPDTITTESAVPEAEAVTQEAEEGEVTVTPEDGISYRVQIGASDKGLPAQRRLQFEKLSRIRTIETLQLDNGMTIYTTGNLKNFDDALKLQSQIRLEGIKDAFVIAVKDGKRINLPRDKQTNQDDN